MSPFERLLSTRYDSDREREAIRILDDHPELAVMQWEGPDEHGKPFVRGSTALHYAANDGKLALMERLVELGADVNASEANWYRSVLSWAANNARLTAIDWLLDHGTSPLSLDALHAAAWGGSSQGRSPDRDYAGTIVRLLEAGADVDASHPDSGETPLDVAAKSRNEAAIAVLKEWGAIATKYEL